MDNQPMKSLTEVNLVLGESSSKALQAEWRRFIEALLHITNALRLYPNPEVTTPQDSPDFSIRFNLDSEQHLGQIVLWQSGRCDLEVIECEHEKIVLFTHIEDTENTELLSAELKRFANYFVV